MSEITQETPTLQGTNDFYCFAVFDSNTKQLLYSKYNFNFDKFKNTNASYATLTNNQLFWIKTLNFKANLGKCFIKL